MKDDDRTGESRSLADGNRSVSDALERLDGPGTGAAPVRTDGRERPDGSQSGPTRSDGGVATGDGSVEYLDAEVNIFRPSTPFMRDHLRVIWTGFAVWAVLVFGPVTLTALAPGAMTTVIPVIGFPLHYFLVAIGAPGGALVLSIWYARKRDQLDDRYGIDHAAPSGGPGDGSGEEVTATDGGESE